MVLYLTQWVGGQMINVTIGHGFIIHQAGVCTVRLRKGTIYGKDIVKLLPKALSPMEVSLNLTPTLYLYHPMLVVQLLSTPIMESDSKGGLKINQR